MGNSADIADFFTKMPAPAWGFLGAILGAIVGGFVTFISQTIQLRHSRSESKKERDFTTRRQVYFEACEAIGQMQYVLGNVGHADLKSFKDELKVAGALYRLQTIAGINLLEKLVDYQAFYGGAFLDLVYDRTNVDSMTNKQKYSLDAHKYHLESYKELTQTYKNCRSDDEIDRVTNQQAELSDKMKRCLEFHDNITEEIFNSQLILVQKGLDYLVQSNILTSNLLVEIRNDLGTSFNKDDLMLFNELVKSSNSLVLNKSSEFLDKIKKSHNFKMPDL